MQALPKSPKDMAMGILSSEKTRFGTHQLPFPTAPACNYLTATGFFLQASGSQMSQERGDTHILAMFRYILGCHKCCVCVRVCVRALGFQWVEEVMGGREDGERDGEEEEGNCSQKRDEREHKMRQEKREEMGEERHQASHGCWIQPT